MVFRKNIKYEWAVGILLFLCYAQSCLAEPINIGSQKQLFIDKQFIQNERGVELVMGRPTTDYQPVIVVDQEWEKAADGVIAPFYACVLKDKDKIRVWYNLHTNDLNHDLAIYYAESDDGVHFVKPDLGLYELNGSRHNNIVIPGRIGGAAVWIDPKAPPSERYKTQAKCYASPTMDKTQFAMYVSPDGIHWTYKSKIKTKGGKDTQSIIFWDEHIEKYVLYSRGKIKYEHNGETHQKRHVRRAVTDDLFGDWTENEIIFGPDEVDLNIYPAPQPHIPVDYYGADVFTYPDAHGPYIMLYQTYWHWRQRDRIERNNWSDAQTAAKLQNKMAPGTQDTRLAVSRDGKTFERSAGRGAFIRLGPEGGTFSRVIWTMPNPVRMDDELWIYYVGSNYDHEKFLDPVSAKAKSGIGRAVLRLDGFVSVDAGYEGGEFTTPLLTFEGRRLYVNLDASAGGSLWVEIQDEHGQPIQGYTQADASSLYGNSIHMPVRWGDNNDIRLLAGKPVQLRFILQDCKLYAFQFGK